MKSLLAAAKYNDHAEIIYDGKKYQGSTQSYSCKTWPTYDNMVIIAIPLRAHGQTMYSSLDIVVIDSNDMGIKYRTVRHDLLENEDYSDGDIFIDTAPYQLNSSHLAFGVRINWDAERRLATTLNLFQPKDNGSLTLVMKGLIVDSHYRLSKSNQMCNSEYAVRKSLLHVRKDDSPSGYQDILLTTIASNTTSTEKFNGGSVECINEELETDRRVDTLVYDGEEYKIPPYLYFYDSY
ncbi:hypothetical protein KAT72_21165 [Aeromonas popoffii]|uniref:Uncharacterized protein n=1 Tax=Aeromonas popoffii TaxID=70856 RepID=A0ABS5GWB8_9GAMM|nr:hypothetical protein [Aeromonas popoffii]MBR7631431.1 hypothetical protein [Aeromonas popoffii]